MSACSTAPRAGSTSPPMAPPLRTGAAPAGGPGRRRDQPVRLCGVAEGTPARRRAQPVGTHDPDTGVTGVSCPVPGHPTGHGRQRSAGGPDRRERGLRRARRRTHRPVVDRPPRRRPKPGRVRGAELPGACRGTGPPKRTGKQPSPRGRLSLGTHRQAHAVRHAAAARAHPGTWPLRARGGRWQRLPGRGTGRVGRALVAALHGEDASGQWRAGAVVGGLAPRCDAAVPGVSAESPCQRQAAGVHRLGRRADGPACSVLDRRATVEG